MNKLFTSVLGKYALLGGGLLALVGLGSGWAINGARSPEENAGDSYRVLAPIESGNLLLFPVVRVAKSAGVTPFLTLDEGIKSGQVEVTEAGKASGLVRPRPSPSLPYDGPARPNGWRVQPPPRGDQVNTLVLVNNSDRPLLLLAGEIVTGGKQDRVIAKDRIVPPGSDPIDLGVFCIEPGRWTEASTTFGASAKAAAGGFMAQPNVREKAMAAKDQHEVWESVNNFVSQMSASAPPVTNGLPTSSGNNLNTTSYARAMQDSNVSAKVDGAAAPVLSSREQVLAQLRQQHAVGVVVAEHGELVWADLFADTDLLACYWTKLVRSYAAESLIAGDTHAPPTVSDAQHFLDMPTGGAETSEGRVGIYRYLELRSEHSETFVLQSLLPGTGYDVHVSKLRIRSELRHTDSPQIYR